MAISKLFKKESAPEELPDLAIDELKKDLKKDYSDKEEIPEKKEEPKKVQEEKNSEEPPKEKAEEEKKENPPAETNVAEKSKEKVNNNNSAEEKNPLEKSFFNPLVTELKKDNFDPSRIDGWYQRTFSDKSAIEWMKEYWEKQKDEFITESIEKEFKKRINERMIILQKLEAEWQEMYINLVKKEEEMKKEERDVKKIIKEFSEVLKKKGNVKKESQIK